MVVEIEKQTKNPHLIKKILDKLPPWLQDIAGLAGFIIMIIVGAIIINNFVFRSFDVIGPSMEPTLEGEGSSDRLIVNRLPITWAKLNGKDYLPHRGDIVVFENPKDYTLDGREYIVKRVIGLPGETVKINNCELKVYNKDNQLGFNPYEDFQKQGKLDPNDKAVNNCIDGDGTNVTVSSGEIFVVGDHRTGSYSMDSRNGGGRSSLGLVPLKNIIGPVSARLWPIDKFRTF